MVDIRIGPSEFDTLYEIIDIIKGWESGICLGRQAVKIFQI